MKARRFGHVLSLIVFSIGVLLGIVLIVIPVWADFESVLFDPGTQTSARLRGLRCPIMITENETGIVRARIKNTLDRPTSFFMRAHITDGYVTMMREVTTQLSLAPGETELVEWPIQSEDAAFERLVLFRVVVRGGYPLPRRGGACGVMVLNVPWLTGNQAYFLGLVLSLAGIVAGGAWWLRNNPDMRGMRVQITRIMAFLAGTVAIGLVLGLAGLWLAGGVVLVLILLTIGVIMGYVINSISS